MKKALLPLLFMPALILNTVYNGGIIRPKLSTNKTATNTEMTMTLPNNYEGSFSANYDGHVWHTSASSSPISSQEQQKMYENFAAMQKQMDDFWQAQQQMFNSMWLW